MTDHAGAPTARDVLWRFGPMIYGPTVLFALAFAWIFLAEGPAPIQFVGGALLLAGVVLVRADASSSGNPRGEAAVIS